MFHPPRFLQTIRLWFLPVLVLVLSVLTLFALMEHAKFEQIKLGSTIHAPY
jgi:cytochrome c-type biogenesis protein CcmH/NrfF